MTKIIVTPDENGVISKLGKIVGAPLPTGAVIIDAPASMELAPCQVAVLDAGAIRIVEDWRGSGPWYDQRAALADRLTARQIDIIGIVPPNDFKRAVTKGWEHMAMTPRDLSKEEKDAQAKAEAVAAAESELARIAGLVVSPVQLRHAANEMGVRALIEAVVSAADTPQDVKDMWEYATEFHRAHPLWAQFAPLIGKTSADIDALFTVAATK